MSERGPQDPENIISQYKKIIGEALESGPNLPDDPTVDVLIKNSAKYDAAWNSLERWGAQFNPTHDMDNRTYHAFSSQLSNFSHKSLLNLASLGKSAWEEYPTEYFAIYRRIYTILNPAPSVKDESYTYAGMIRTGTQITSHMGRDDVWERVAANDNDSDRPPTLDGHFANDPETRVAWESLVNIVGEAEDFATSEAENKFSGWSKERLRSHLLSVHELESSNVSEMRQLYEAVSRKLLKDN